MAHQAARSSRSARRGGAGLILVVLITLAIILVLYFGNFGGGSYMQGVQQTREQGRQMHVQVNTQQLMTLITQYKLQNDRLPSSVEDLEAPAAAFRDPWGQQITFEFEQNGASTTVVFRSPGPDGESGTEDDVVMREPMPV